MLPSLDSTTLLRLVGQTILLLAFISFIIQWLAPRFSKLWFKNTSNPELDIKSVEKNKVLRESIRSNQQGLHTEKAASFNERILIPREQEKLKQKEDDYLKFCGPAWKGKGNKLGGSEDDLEVDMLPSSSAARRRQLPEPETTDIKYEKPEPKVKRIIVLPPEPKDTDDNVVTIRLRTPIRSFCQRRFQQSDSIQDLLDYMTTVGYSQTFYTLSTTYPRSVLTQYAVNTLQQMAFGKQITLNIEEKD